MLVNGTITLLSRRFFTDEETSVGKRYDEVLICQMIDFLIDKLFTNYLYIKIGNYLFGNCIGIPMGTSCATLLANLFLYFHEVEF